MMSLDNEYRVPRTVVDQLKISFSEDKSNINKLLIEAALGHYTLQVVAMRKVRLVL